MLNFISSVSKLSIFLLFASIVSPSPPSITKQPPATFLQFKIDKNQTGTITPFKLDCEATGEPEPKYKWIKNNAPLQLNDRITHQLPHKGTITFTNINDDDKGVYQCLAENLHGIALSNKVSVSKWNQIEYPNFPSKVVKEVNRGEPMTLDCSTMTGFPKQNIFWLLMSPTGSFSPINDSRIASDPEGRLHFSNVSITDVLETTYCCSLFTTFENNAIFENECKMGVKIKIVGISSTPLTEPTEQYISPINIVGLKNDSLDLHCIFGGTPLPEIQWTKKNGDLPLGRHEFLNHGKTLRLKNIEFDDEGSYECKAFNGIGNSHFGTIHVVVQARPYWITEPYNILTSEGESIEFKCNAKGIPVPEIEWFINGVPQSDVPSNPRRTVLNSTLIRIEKLEKSDTAVYQCNASNSLGYVFKNFYINVLDIAPVILKIPKNNYETLEGSSLLLPCKVIGAPKPEIQWKRYENVSRHNVFDNGDLKIENATFEDSANYSCTATNKYGVAVSENLVVKVIERIRIITAPEDYEIAAGSRAVFRCKTTSDNNADLQIDWLRNGQLISFDDNPIMYKSVDNSLVITETHQVHSANYTCIARTKFDSANATALLVVQDVPNAPQIIETVCKGFAVYIKWQSPEDNNAPILFYQVQYRTSFEPDKWEIYHNRIPATDFDLLAYLSPWSNSSFRVLASNKVGLSLPSESSRVCTSPTDKPHKNPDDVQGQGSSATNLIISWKAMPPIEHNAPGFFYRIRYRLLDSEEANWTGPIDIYNWEQTTYEVENAETYQAYLIEVEANNAMGPSSVAAPTVIGYSGEDVPLQAPSNFTLVRVIDGYNAVFSWDPVPLESVRGHLKGYKVEMWTNYKDEWKYTIPPELTRVRLGRLKPFSINYVKLRVVNNKFEGPPSPQISVQTPEEVPGPVSSLYVVARGSTTLYLKWDKPLEPNGILTGYFITFAKIQSSQIGPNLDMVITNSNRTEAKISNLQENAKYRVSIAARNSRGKGVTYFIEESTAESQTLAKPSFSWQISSSFSGATHVEVSLLPLSNQHVGNEVSFQYREKGDEKWLPIEEELSFVTRHVELVPGSYELRITVADGDQYFESDTREVQIPNLYSNI